MGSAVGSLLGSAGIGAAINIGSKLFSSTTLASSLGNLATQGLGQAVTGATQQLTQFGLPNFVLKAITSLVDKVVKSVQLPTQPGADKVVQDNFGDAIKKLVEELTQSIIDAAKKILELEKGGGGKPVKSKKPVGSWLEAIAKAMGEAAGSKAAKMVELSNKLQEISSQNVGDDQKQLTQQATDMNVTNAQFQAVSQEFNILQSAFSNAIKSLGEGMTQMARKG